MSSQLNKSPAVRFLLTHSSTRSAELQSDSRDHSSALPLPLPLPPPRYRTRLPLPRPTTSGASNVACTANDEIKSVMRSGPKLLHAINQSSPRQLWRLVDLLLGRERPHASNNISVDQFHKFFGGKGRRSSCCYRRQPAKVVLSCARIVNAQRLRARHC